MNRHIDEKWSIDLPDMIDYKNSNFKGFICIFIIIDNFSKKFWPIPLPKKYNRTVTDAFLNILPTSNRSPPKN